MGTAGCNSTSEPAAKGGFRLKLEAEAAELQGVRVDNALSGYTGVGYVTDFFNEGDCVTFTVSVPESRHYRVTVMAAVTPGGGIKFNELHVDGAKIGDFMTRDSGAFEPCSYPRVYMTAGEHKVSVAKGWGYFHVDSLIIDEAEPMDRGRFDVKPELVNPDASLNAKRLMKYICDIYGKKILSGQQTWDVNPPELSAIFDETGKYPAVRGFDFINYSPSRVEHGTSSIETDEAIDWWKEGGIVAFCWHWNAPKDLIDQPPDKVWSSGFYTYATTFDIEKAMNDTESEEYRLILRDIDAISEQVKKLRDEGVPVLWRPLHEAAGRWFWWGAKGPEPCKKLWKLLYDRMTNYHKLDNLIWVWNGQHHDWYPGDEYVDIIGEDIYAGARAYSSQAGRFCYALEYTKANKVIALTENGTIPDPDMLILDEAPWAWFCTWCGSFVWKEADGKKVYSEDKTEASMLKKVYDHEYVITKDKLPDLKAYPLD